MASRTQTVNNRSTNVYQTAVMINQNITLALSYAQPPLLTNHQRYNLPTSHYQYNIENYWHAPTVVSISLENKVIHHSIAPDHSIKLNYMTVEDQLNNSSLDSMNNFHNSAPPLPHPFPLVESITSEDRTSSMLGKRTAAHPIDSACKKQKISENSYRFFKHKATYDSVCQSLTLHILN